MALVQLNNYSVGDPNATASYTTLDATRRGLAEVSLSNYDTDSAPVVKVGSIFANAGALIELQSSDATPTGYSGISNSTTFYLYYDESAEVFIYSSTSPSWSDVYQGWYNGLDRALFSMYKDSGGTLYQYKTEYNGLGSTPIGIKTKRVNIGAWNMDTTNNVIVAHGISNLENILHIDVFIRDDSELNVLLLNYNPNAFSGYYFLGGTSISLYRVPGGFFDGIGYDSTSINRGWITVTYA